GPEGAALAAGFPFGAEHEVVDDELAATLEEVGERLPAARALEDVRLVDPDPRQRAPLSAELVAQPRALLLPGEEGRACGEPFLARDHLAIGKVHAFSLLPAPRVERSRCASFSRMLPQPCLCRAATSSLGSCSCVRMRRVPPASGPSAIVTRLPP